MEDKRRIEVLKEDIFKNGVKIETGYSVHHEEGMEKAKKLERKNENIEFLKDDNDKIVEITHKKDCKIIKRVLIEDFKDKNSNNKKKVIEIYKVETLEIKNILVEINKVFIKIMIEMHKFANSLDEKDKNHAFIIKYFKLDFNKMNEMLESNDLYLISKLINKNKKYL